MKFAYADLNNGTVTGDIQMLFPDFGKDEVLLIMSPHDDDAVIGAGYAMLAAKAAGADVYVMIFCRGDAGYSTVEEKSTIEEVRARETIDCYARMGIAADHIIRLNFPDFSAIGNVGWEKADGRPGDMPTILRFLREHKVTRVMIPNHYHEHIDHYAAYMMSSFDVPQAGDAALVDHGTPFPVRSTLQYSVWADLDPEDAMLHGRKDGLRANRMLIVDSETEQLIDDAIAAYVSQEQIIEGLVRSRQERKSESGHFVEVYLTIDCRPKMNFAPYTQWVDQYAANSL